MSTKTYIFWIVVIAIILNIMTYPGYDTMLLAAPIWLWVNISAALVVCVLNIFKANQWREEKDEEDQW